MIIIAGTIISYFFIKIIIWLIIYDKYFYSNIMVIRKINVCSANNCILF